MDMSERVEKAVQSYFSNFPCPVMQIGERYWFSKGYEQAEKDTIERIIEYLKNTNHIEKKDLIKYLQNESGDNPDGILRATINSSF